MEAFCEQVVKRKRGIKQILLSAVLIALFVLTESFFIFVYFLIVEPFWMVVTLVVGILAVAILVVALPRINNVDYDYSVVGNILCIDKVTDKKARKKLLRIEIGNIEDLGKLSALSTGERFARKNDCSDGNLEECFYCIYRESGRGKCLLIFSPKQNIIDGMRPSMTRELFMKYYYNR